MSLAELPAPTSSTEALGRTPPQDISAEQSVLGGMLLSKDAIADVIEVLRGNDFYRPAHEIVFDAVLDLFGRGEPADAVTVAAELTKRGELGRIGGPAYLHTLISSVPTAANAGYYAQIVAERAVLRRLVAAGTRIVQMGYAADGGDVEDLVNAAQAEVYSVSERRTTEDYLPLGEIIEGTIDEIEASSARGDGLIGVPTGFVELDRLTNGLHGGQMIVIAARPAVGKSTVGLDIARSCSIHHGLASVIFSLEMSRTEITMRLLSAEARIPLQNMRKGSMRDEDWTRLARTMGDISAAPLFIDDSPNMSLMEIRAKCRRIKQQHGLRLVIIDYLQLMTSGKKVESRQQEVSEFSRALKLLAKELEVPVIAISQLNRGPEQRTDKKPMVSDLRESGCLTPETTVLRADTGAETTLGELYAAGAQDVPVWALDDRLRYVRRHLTHVFPTGVKPVHRLRLASGKQITATANHPFLTYDGWTPLGDLTVGSRVGVPRHVPAPEVCEAWEEGRVVALAGLLANGTVVGPEAVPAWWEELSVEARGPQDSAGLPGAEDQQVPEAVHHLPKAQIALFLRELWAGAGSVSLDPDGAAGLLRCVSPSRGLVTGVSRLLLRFGISTVLSPRPRSGGRDAWELRIEGLDDQRRFLQEIGVANPADASVAERLLAIVLGAGAPASGPVLPRQVWGEVRELLLREAAAAKASSQVRGGSLALIADRLDEADLDVEAVNDILWDEVVAIEPLGERQVFDATVLGTHNFIANGIAVHNSIEQDADMVILLHREDMYEKESPRAGEADFIVAKHRNGPTATITVAFQGHYSRFVDMAS